MNLDEKSHQLQSFYQRFNVKERLLFTGHSHQAWPDVAREGLLESFDDAAHLIDKKWDKVFDKIEILRNYLKNWYADPKGQYSYAASTHDLMIKWLSALRLTANDEILTTNHEFYSVFRQLKALQQEGIQVRFIDSDESNSIAERIISAISTQTKAVIVSRVFYDSGMIFQDLSEIAKICVEKDIPLLIDDYHGTNVSSEKIGNTVFEQTYWLIGGYKYLQWGEGNCFLRYPESCKLKPVYTGWFASFSTLHGHKEKYSIEFDDQMKFAGATFEPSSAFRASRVVQFFQEQNLTADWLTNMYRSRVGEIISELKKRIHLDTHEIEFINEVQAENRSGFLAIRSKNAVLWQNELLKSGIYSDARGDVLRFGPAPYITSEQIVQLSESFNVLVRNSL